jgi:hypothetical protein
MFCEPQNLGIDREREETRSPDAESIRLVTIESYPLFEEVTSRLRPTQLCSDEDEERRRSR